MITPDDLGGVEPADPRHVPHPCGVLAGTFLPASVQPKSAAVPPRVQRTADLVVVTQKKKNETKRKKERERERK